MSYGVSLLDRELALYLMARTHLQKARNIARDHRAAVVVPSSRQLLWFVPPATIQLHGRAEILDWTDAQGIEVFRRFWLGRRILDSYRESSRGGEKRICFVRIVLDPLVRTYMLGHSVWNLRNPMEAGGAKVRLPPAQAV